MRSIARGFSLSLLLCCFLSSPAFSAGASVAVDQVGYTTAARKVAVTPVNADSFRVVDAVSRQVVFRGATGLASLADQASGMQLWNGDFSAVQKPGRYVLFLSNGDSSQQFSIADSIYMPVYRASLKGFFNQRCGMPLSPVYAGLWYRGGCHTLDATFHATAGGTGTLDETGGWHDAGDYGKYVVNAGISVGTLLAAYEWFPARFAADDLNIPESGNGVPDILDEARYELRWLLKMQAPTGGVYNKITRTSFEDFIMPNLDSGTRYIYQVSSCATADFAAMTARASRVYRLFDTTFANACLAAAARAWQFLQSNPSIVPPGGFKNPSGTSTGEYGDGNDSDERLWASAELYLASGDASAHAYFLANYASGGVRMEYMGWQFVKPMAELAYLCGSRSGINTTVQSQIRSSLLTYAQSFQALHDQSGFGAALGLNDYYWGSNSQALNNAILMIMAAEQGGSTTFTQAALDQLHYVLGVNAHGQSFVTGLGDRHTMHPHHRPSGSDNVYEPVPGLISGGPNHNITQDPVLQAHFTTSTPPALCYIDDQGSYASNEICINWNAPLVFVAGYFARIGATSAVTPRKVPLPSGFELRQNYPNPFNPSTTLSYALPQAARVKLTVFDSLGREVAVLLDGEMAPGEHQVTWNAAGCASGLYVARLEARRAGNPFEEARTMLLLK